MFRHVRFLGKPERCLGYKHPPAGESLRGTEWAIDQAAATLQALDQLSGDLNYRPILNGIGPFSANYEGLWHQMVMRTIKQQADLRVVLEELLRNQAEWRLGAITLGPTPIHRASLWKCRAGTAVPLCHSTATNRPSGEPILMPSDVGVGCDACISMMKLFPSLTGIKA